MARTSVEFVDSDAHVVEGQALMAECIRRWPDAFSFTEKGELLTEGRRYPEHEGPGAGCPPEHGLSKVLTLSVMNCENYRESAFPQMNSGTEFPYCRIGRVGCDSFPKEEVIEVLVLEANRALANGEQLIVFGFYAANDTV